MGVKSSAIMGVGSLYDTQKKHIMMKKKIIMKKNTNLRSRHKIIIKPAGLSMTSQRHDVDSLSYRFLDRIHN